MTVPSVQSAQGKKIDGALADPLPAVLHCLRFEVVAGCKRMYRGRIGTYVAGGFLVGIGAVLILVAPGRNFLRSGSMSWLLLELVSVATRLGYGCCNTR
jgi:hypothetical protein